MNKEQNTVLIVTPYFPPHGGGLERYAFEIAQRLQNDHDWRVVIVTSGERYARKIIKDQFEGLTVYRLGYHYKLSNTPWSFAWKKQIKHILEKEHPDIINIHMPVPGIGDAAALVAGKTPIVITYHAGSMHKNKLLPDLLIGIYEMVAIPLLMKRANRIVCSSEFIQFGLLKKYLDKSSTITPAVDSDLFKPDETKNPQQPTVLFVAGLGRAEVHKGLKVLLDAFAITKRTILNAHLNIVGDGDNRKEYEQYVSHLKLTDSVTFRGRLAGTALVESFQNCSVLVLPSLAPAESFGMVLIEAMACGKPVIGSNAGGIPQVVNSGENGLLIPINDRKALAVAMDQVLGDPTLAKRFGDFGNRMIQGKYSWKVQAERYENLLASLLL